jgi:pilus assembly protein CpaF
MALWRSSSSTSQDSRQTAVASAPSANVQREKIPYMPPDKRRSSPRLVELRKKVRSELLTQPEEADHWSRKNPEHVDTISARVLSYIKKAGIELSEAELEELRNGLLDDLLGFGPIEPLINDRTCSEIMVNGPEIIFAESKGKLRETDLVFDDDAHVQWIAQRIVRRIGRSLNREQPMTDARLPDGSRVHLIMPPSALHGTTITIRKFPEKALTADDLIRFGSFTNEVATFLEACVAARLNIVVSGGTGSGKTTLLNVLSAFIPDDERIVTIEDSAELQLTQRHVVSLETAPPVPGAPPIGHGESRAGQLVVRDLVKGSLRMRPDRIVVGECRSGEALDMLQAMNTGHDGSLTTVHANSPRDCIARLETLSLMSGLDLPVSVVRRQIASAIQLVVQQSRLKDGSRKIVQISEVQGMEGEQVVIQDLFVYKTADYHGHGPSNSGGGTLVPVGVRPKCIDRLEHSGFKLDADVFLPKEIY